MISEFSVILENYSFLECPRWREGRLWVSDFFMHQVVSCRRDGSDVRIEAQAPGRPAGLGWLPDGRLLVVSMEDHKILRREADGSIAVHADLSAYATGLLNDMIVDPEGRAFVGNFGFDSDGGAPVKTADLMRVDPDGAITLAASGMHFPNGCVLLGDTLVVAETAGNRLSAFAVQAEGSLGPRRDWARFGDVPTSTDFMEVIGRLVMAPDGICADCEGAIWIADALGNRAVRIREGGEITDIVDAGTGVYACALGGDDGDTLYLCTAPSFAEQERRDKREARLLAVKVKVPA